MITEQLLEELSITLLIELGYTRLYSSEITPDESNAQRTNYDEVVLVDRLRTALKSLNPNTPSEALDEAIRKITRPETSSLLENNRRFHKLLIEGIPVEYSTSDRIVHDQVQLIDFINPDRNDWLVVNQFTVTENRRTRRPDVIVFINGLPLAVIELKKPTDEKATVRQAFNQLQTYKCDIPSLLYL